MDSAKASWNESRVKLKQADQLSDKAHLRSQLEEKRREQRVLDDIAIQRYVRE